MLQQTKAIVLRSVKYGETSLICTVFTQGLGIQSYMVQGIRKGRSSRAGLLQPAWLLDMVVYHKPNTQLQRIREFQPAYLYQHLQEDVVKNSVALFCVEVLLKLLPEHAPATELFDFGYDFFCRLDVADGHEVGNYPLFFIIRCAAIMGYTLHGSYTEHTPYLDMKEGSFSAHAPAWQTDMTDEDTRALAALLPINDIGQVHTVAMGGAMRYKLLNWYIGFLQQHSQHLGTIRSLQVLQAVLH